MTLTVIGISSTKGWLSGGMWKCILRRKVDWECYIQEKESEGIQFRTKWCWSCAVAKEKWERGGGVEVRFNRFNVPVSLDDGSRLVHGVYCTWCSAAWDTGELEDVKKRALSNSTSSSFALTEKMLSVNSRGSNLSIFSSSCMEFWLRLLYRDISL